LGRNRRYLHFHVDEQKLRGSLERFELGDHVRRPRAAFREAREGLGVKETERPEIEPGFDFGIEELQKIPQELVQELLEELVMGVARDAEIVRGVLRSRGVGVCRQGPGTSSRQTRSVAPGDVP